MGELTEGNDDSVDRAFSGGSDGLRVHGGEAPNRTDYLEALCRGGYLEVQQLSDRIRRRWVDRYVETTVARLLGRGRIDNIVVIGNADGHGKNLAFLHRSPGVISLAPLYDTVPTVLFPGLTIDAAMSIGGTVTLDEVDTAAIVRSAKRWHHPADRAAASAAGVAVSALEAIDNAVIDPDGQLASLVRKRAPRFLA